jgi:hypothetical protein
VTTITNDPAATPLACASGLGNGTYALILYYWGPQEMSAPSQPEPAKIYNGQKWNMYF